ncbi:MAG TPA: hypothetical protein VE862_10435 [Candidatus Acidoferrum sp.]|nr:hypothetical protein [Candidatus Acidoferrum sp.]
MVSSQVSAKVLEAVQNFPVGSPVIINLNVEGSITNLNVGNYGPIGQTNISEIRNSFNQQLERCSELDTETKAKAVRDASELSEGASKGNITLSRAKELISSLSAPVSLCADLAPYVTQLIQYVRVLLGI